MIRLTVELLLAMMLAVTSADLLYLYYGGHWYDPIRWIEVFEVVMFWFFILGGISYMAWRVKRESDD